MAGKGAPKTGGRTKGTPNKVNEELEAFREAARDEGLSPVEFLKLVYRNATLDWNLRLRAAQICAPFCHPTYQAVAVHHTGEQTLSIRSDEQIGRSLAHLLTVQSNEPKVIEAK